MNSIGWGSKTNRGNAAAHTTMPVADPHSYDKNSLKGRPGVSEPLSQHMSGGAGWPITAKGADQWGFVNAKITPSRTLSPGSFNTTYLKGSKDYDMSEPAPEPGSRAYSEQVLKGETGKPTLNDINETIKSLPMLHAEALEETAEDEASKKSGLR